MNTCRIITKRTCATGVAIACLLLMVVPAGALDLRISVDPVVTGIGESRRALYPQVATVDGKQLDLVAEIVDQEPSFANHEFSRSEDDFAFQLSDSSSGQTMARVRYTLVESGTATHVTAEKLNITVSGFGDGDDDDESAVGTADATKYVLEGSGGVRVEDNGLHTQFIASEESGVVMLCFPGRAFFEITYYGQGDDDDDEARFVHDGDGDVVFENPQQSAPRIFCTYQFSNPSTVPVEVQFYDSLPSGLQWDETFEPVFRSTETMDFGTMPWWLALIMTWLSEHGMELHFNPDGTIVVDANYANAGRDIVINNLIIPPGEFELKLSTHRTGLRGMIHNEASITPISSSGLNALSAEASVDLLEEESAPAPEPETPTSAATTKVIDADADTSIAKNVPTWSGDTTQLYATADSAAPSQTLLWFDLSDDIPQGAAIDSAALYLTSTDPHGTDGAFALHQILVNLNWTEGGFSWNAANNGLEADGMELGSTAVDHSEQATTIPGVAGSSDRKTWDVTALVQTWVDDSSRNHGMAILAPAPDREIFCSSEHLSASVRPKLVVTWRE